MSTKQSTLLLEHHLKQLKLPTMLREYAAIAAQCTQDRGDYPTYLLRLAERELLDRECRAAERRVKSAGFPVVKTLDSFDFNRQPSLNQALVRELASGEYMDHRENVLLIGNSGTGKTHLATALALSRLPAGAPCPLLHGDRTGDPAPGTTRRANPGAIPQATGEVASPGA